MTRKEKTLKLPKSLVTIIILIVLTSYLSSGNGSITISYASQAGKLDLSQAVVVTPSNLNGPENKAINMLLDEVGKRTQLRWQRSTSWPTDSTPVIAVGPISSLKSFASDYGAKLVSRKESSLPEGFSVHVDMERRAPAVIVAGNDSRGVLFGVGYLLRKMNMSKGKVDLTGNISITTAPQYPMRGHQLGYRPKPNSYDGWDLAMWEQYIRDLAVFGSNAIELIPPESDDEKESPHYPLSEIDAMIGMSRISDEYGLDVWIWYPAMDKDYSDPQTVELALKKWGDVFKKLPRIDAVFVPGGDPGHTHPKHLMALLEKQTANLRRYHPKAQMWVAPQSFGKTWMKEFMDIVKREPTWLGGIAYGPQTAMSLPDMRAAIPKKYPIRHYPDITHSLIAQYPVIDWDVAFARTQAREVINPRPVDQAHIFRTLQPLTVGFIAYSEGCNDDVNKIVWSGLGWNQNADVMEILRDYSRYFIGSNFTDGFANGLMALERNWRGPVLTNGGITSTLQQFQAMERGATPQQLLNWRFQQALYRAYYDAYVKARLTYEKSLEEQAMCKLREAKLAGSFIAMDQAEQILNRATLERTATDLRARIFELAEALYQSIRMQLSVERYKAQSIGRGANLDTVDLPLNNGPWLKEQFAEIRKITSEADRVKRIDELVNWTNPGPGGFYDDLGNPSMQPHLVKGRGFEEDPGLYETSRVGFPKEYKGPVSWWNHAESQYEAPLKMQYKDLDPTAQYKLRVVYAGEVEEGKLQLMADERIEIHPFIKKEHRPMEFDIPMEATRDGILNLTWQMAGYDQGKGRGNQVAEVWLIKK
jgi:hypothetical protein